MYTLYYSPGACSMAVHITLEALKVPYQLEFIDLSRRQQRSTEYRQINPMAKVPALNTEHGILTEVSAILVFLAEKHRDTVSLIPDTATFSKAKCLQWLNYFASEIQPTYARFYRPERFSENSLDAQGIKQIAQHRLIKMFELIDTQLCNKSYLVDEQLSIADIYLYVLCSWIGYMQLPLSPCEHLMRHFAHIGNIPVVKNVVQQEKRQLKT